MERGNFGIQDDDRSLAAVCVATAMTMDSSLSAVGKYGSNVVAVAEADPRPNQP